jgi:hypothetical protein
MHHRYALRFENTERRGETIPITGSGASVGRKPGNAIQVLDASVSGRHAELVVDSEGVLLRDLGSTNGTRVGADRVSEQRLAHADQVLFGNVRMVFLDSEVGDVPIATAPESERATASSEAADAVHTVSAERVARSSKPSLVGAVVLIALAGGAAGAWFWMKSRGQTGPTHAVRAVEPVSGNLLADGYSFEGDTGAWTSEEGAPAAFGEDTTARRSGDTGLEAAVDANEWALSRSPAARVTRGRTLVATAWVRTAGDVDAALGLQFESSTDAAAPTVAWSKPIQPSPDFESVEVRSSVPPVYDQARIVVRARGNAASSSLDLDDASLVVGEAAPAPPTIDEFQLITLGTPPTAAVLHKIDHQLLSNIAVLSGATGVDARASEMSVEKRDNGFGIGCGSGAGRTLALRAEPTLANGGLATIGAGGYRTHGVEFTREGATSLLFGSGKDEVALVFPSPVDIRGKPDNGGFQIEAALGGATSVLMQLSFRAERDEAQALARTAREAEKQSQLGSALAQWAKLRDQFPFESTLLDEAEATSARLITQGLSETRELRYRAERARFFRLVDLFRQCKTAAQQTAAKYEGSEVQTEALALVESIQKDLGALEADLDKAEVARLRGMVNALETQKSPKLAQLVRDYLGERYGDHAGGGR